MQAQATFRGERRMSVGLFVAVIALLVAFMLGGASGYIVKALTAPVTTGTQVVTIPQSLPQRTILPNQA
jgi:ABC-type dipeptide/oligopeptide/nickel transport system permease subunit